jgi:hypothetical protein
LSDTICHLLLGGVSCFVGGSDMGRPPGLSIYRSLRLARPFTKQGVTDEQVNGFLLKNFNLSFLKTKIVYSLVQPIKCKPPMLEFFIVNDKLLVPVGATFYLYGKAAPDAALTAADSADLLLPPCSDTR